LIIHYSNNKDELIFNDERLIKKYYSNDFKHIINRLSELRASNNLSEISELPPPRRHKLSGRYNECWGICCSKNDRLIIQPYGEYDINNLSSITEVKIIAFTDYH
jgi:proteic killer suppression protein